MKITLDVSKVLLLDTDFTPSMLENNQAVVCEIEGKSVLMINIDLDDITEQVKSYINPQDLTSICLKCGIDLGKCICK